ncbi:hypothetical protein T4E_8078, partial [Trichinella pseudospiralis]
LNDSAASNDDQLCLSTRKKRTEDDAALACQGSELLSYLSQGKDARLLPEMNNHDHGDENHGSEQQRGIGVALDAAEELEDTDLSTDVSLL